MPRLAPSLVRQAWHQNGLLALLLRECRDLPSAQNELRWLKGHALSTARNGSRRPRNFHGAGWRTSLVTMVKRRSRGVPLQYILGSQPFEELDILCRPGVLIPRPETEMITSLLAAGLRRLNALKQPQKSLKILDLCSGSGCISLLLYKLLKQTQDPRPNAPWPTSHDQSSFINTSVEVRGLEISETAFDLANRNLARNIALGVLSDDSNANIRFQLADVTTWSDTGRWDVIVSNPPYISPTQFTTSTTRSVRKYEPKLALVPPGDTLSFYQHILRIACSVGAKVIAMEVSDTDQAWEVVQLVDEAELESKRFHKAILCDDGNVVYLSSPQQRGLKLESTGRAVLLWQES